MTSKRGFPALILTLIFILTACSSVIPAGNPPPNSTLTPFQPLQPTLVIPSPIPPTETTTPTPLPYRLWLDPGLPDNYQAKIEVPLKVSQVIDPEQATLTIKVGGDDPDRWWVYALAAPFPTIPDGVSFADIQETWQGHSSGPFEGQPLRMTADTREDLTALWGAPAQGVVVVHSPGELLDIAWNTRPSWAIVPFEDLEPRWKVLKVDGVSPLDKDFNVSDYPLSLPIGLAGDPAQVQELVASLLPPGNRDPGKLTIVALTGVTALVRATGWTMDMKGVTYPAQDVGEILRNADITHISNEVPFAENCPEADPYQTSLRFCSDDRYIALLEEVGTDVVELTGDHFGDWGRTAMLHTLEMYDERGWLVYGGGANEEEGKLPVVLEHNGNRIAFIGCNGKGKAFAKATSTNPGAVVCDFPYITEQITAATRKGVLPIGTFQHYEYYVYKAQPYQVRDSRKLTAAGAVVVSGSQAHHPQAFEFSDGGLIHHGLGNLFFDQYGISEATRDAFIDLHVVYDGRHISTELVTIKFVDYARPRLMTEAERAKLLGSVFKASGW